MLTACNFFLGVHLARQTCKAHSVKKWEIMWKETWAQGISVKTKVSEEWNTILQLVKSLKQNRNTRRINFGTQNQWNKIFIKDVDSFFKKPDFPSHSRYNTLFVWNEVYRGTSLPLRLCCCFLLFVISSTLSRNFMVGYNVCCTFGYLTLQFDIEHQ